MIDNITVHGQCVTHTLWFSPQTALSTVDLAETSTDDEEEPLASGSRGARLLHMARRAERNLLSYERSGWLEVGPWLSS